MAGRLASTKSAGLGQVIKAISGDIVMAISPTTLVSDPISTTWSRSVSVKITDSAGNIHKWLTADYATTNTIGNDSSAGEATIDSVTLSIVEGVGEVVVSGDAKDWLDSETDTLTIASIVIAGMTVAGGTSVETFTTP